MGISRTPDGNTGWKVTAACQWRTGGRSHFPSQFGSVLLSSLPFLWVSPHSDSHIHTCSLVPVQIIRSHSAAPDSSLLCWCFMMTHCASEAKQACVCAVAAIVRALRSRLKSLRCLLLHAGSDTSCQQPTQTFSSGQREQTDVLYRKTGGTVLDCCGPAHPSLAVSSPECLRSQKRLHWFVFVHLFGLQV